MKSIMRLATALVAVAFIAVPANAALINVLLGDQDFADGDPVFSFQFMAASVGEPFPFDDFHGSDPNTDFSESWTFVYAPIVNPLETIISASIEFGIADHDAAYTGHQLKSFLMDGVDLTTPLDALFEASGGANNEYNVFTVPLSSFAELEDGSATFSLALQGMTPGLLDPLDFNGAGLDFARLMIETRIDTEPPTPGVPEPSTTLLLFGGVVGLVTSRRRNR